MVVCIYFQQGKCRNGQRCRYEHVYSSKYSYNASSTHAEYAVAGDKLSAQVASDAEEVLRGNIWPLTGYSPFRDKGEFPDLTDVSPEESRFLYYEAARNNSATEAVKFLNKLTSEARKKYELLLQPSEATIKTIGALYNGDKPIPTPFSNMYIQKYDPTIFWGSSNINTANNIFNEQNDSNNVFQNGSSLFTHNAQSVFAQGVKIAQSVFAQGSANPQSVFAQGSANPPSVFAQGSANPQSVFAQGSANPQSVFAQGSANPQSVFAQGSVNPQSVFAQGSANPQSVFAQGSVNPQSVFAQGSANPPSVFTQGSANPQSVFAQGSANPQSAFAQGSANPQSVFAQVNQSNTLMNDALATSQAPVTSIYSNQEQLSESDLAEYNAQEFTLGRVPLLPPTLQLCSH